MAELTLSHESNEVTGEPIFEYDGAIASGSTGEYIILPVGAGKVSVWNAALIVGSGNSGKVQYTISSKAKIVANTATWFDWEVGTVTSSANTSFENITGVRGVSISGAISIQVRVS